MELPTPTGVCWDRMVSCATDGETPLRFGVVPSADCICALHAQITTTSLFLVGPMGFPLVFYRVDLPLLSDCHGD